MAAKKEAKKKVKVVYFNCQYCNKGLKTPGAKTNHEKSCPLNPVNQEPKIKSSEIAKTIPPELQEKLQEQLSPKLPTFTEEEKQKLEKISTFIKSRSEDQQETDSNLQAAEKIKSRRGIVTEKGKFMNAVADIQGMKPDQEITLPGALAFSVIEDTLQSRRMNQLILQERYAKLNQPKEKSSDSKIQDQITASVLKKIIETSPEDDMESFTKKVEFARKIGELVGDKEKGAGEYIADTVGKLGEQIAPALLDMAKQKQQQAMPPQIPQQNPTQQNPNIESNNPGVEPKVLENEGGATLPAPSPAPNLNEEISPQPISNPEPSDEQLMKMPQLRDDHYAGGGDFGVDSNYFNQYLNLDRFKKFAPSSTA